MHDTTNNILKTLIVEDHPDSLNQLKSLLGQFREIHIIGEARDGKSAIELIRRCNPHLVLLDIQLPDMDGFDVLKSIRHEQEPAVIFITAYDKYAVQAFEFNGVDYLLKPVEKERLKKAIARIPNLKDISYARVMEAVKYLMEHKPKKIRFTIRKGDRLLVFPQEEVFYFKVEDRYLYLGTYENTFFYNSTLKQLEESLEPDLFLRVNKSSIISLDKIRCLKRDYLNRYRVILTDRNNTAIKVSRNCLSKLKEKLNNLLL